MITERLEKSLRDVISKAPELESSSLNVILECYFKLGEAPYVFS